MDCAWSLVRLVLNLMEPPCTCATPNTNPATMTTIGDLKTSCKMDLLSFHTLARRSNNGQTWSSAFFADFSRNKHAIKWSEWPDGLPSWCLVAFNWALCLATSEAKSCDIERKLKHSRRLG